MQDISDTNEYVQQILIGPLFSECNTLPHLVVKINTLCH
jgi:hypothetical protein